MATILCVDDDESITESYSMLCGSLRYSVLIASNGKEGYELAVSHHPDIIITDFDMPQMNGFEMYLALQNNPISTNIPLIGSGSFHSEQRARLPYFLEKGASGLGELVQKILHL